MARIIKFFSIVVLLFVPFVNAETLSTIVTPQNVSFEQCSKSFNINSENLFYLTLAGINANRFRIDEIQSKMGYILFNAVNKEYLASVIKVNSNTSLLKITPANNVYYFPPGVVLNLFKYIEVNKEVNPVLIN